VQKCELTVKIGNLETQHFPFKVETTFTTNKHYPNASTNLNSFGMNARAVSDLTRCSWYKALKWESDLSLNNIYKWE